MSGTWRRRAVTLVIGLLGGGLFILLNLPLPWLLGPMFACLIAGLANAPMAPFGQITVLMRTILGVAVGASIKPELLTRLPDIAGSLAFTPLFVLAIGAIGYPYFRKICGFSKPTAYYAAMPGGLQDMIVFGEEAGADVKALSLVHATRVLVIVSTLPFILAWGFDIYVNERPAPGNSVATVPLRDLALMAFCAVAGWKIAERIKLFGASIVGPMILTAALSLSGIITQRPPAEAIILAQLFIGMGVGVKYLGATLSDLRLSVAAALGYTALLAAIATVFGFTVIQLGFAPALEGLLAYTPGGQAEMTILAIVAGADVAFVVTHHILRIAVVILGAPIVARWL